MVSCPQDGQAIISLSRSASISCSASAGLYSLIPRRPKRSLRRFGHVENVLHPWGRGKRPWGLTALAHRSTVAADPSVSVRDGRDTAG